MKKTKLLLVLVIGVCVCLVMSGCTSRIERDISSLESIVEDIEANGENYTLEEWESMGQAYEALTEHIVEYSDQLTPEQNREVGRLHARYHKAVAKKAINNISDYMDAASEQIKGYCDELFGDEGDWEL